MSNVTYNKCQIFKFYEYDKIFYFNLQCFNPHCVPFHKKPEKSVENPVSYQQFEKFTFANC